MGSAAGGARLSSVMVVNAEYSGAVEARRQRDSPFYIGPATLVYYTF